MRRHSFQYAVLVLLTLALAFPVPARADGIIIPEPPVCQFGPCDPFPISQLAIRYHRVDVTIENQVATTHVDQVFYNPNDWVVEGTYVFPLPTDAVVGEFVLWIDGQRVEGEVLDAEEARGIYEEIVRTMRDPALLEYIGQGAVQASVFPIPPQGERRIELEYTQALTAENGLVRYVYPLNTEKFSVLPLEQVSISVDVRTSQSIRAVYSPTHQVGISRESDTHVRAGYEASNVTPDADFRLYYSIGESEAFHLLTYRDPGDPQDSEGFFLLMLAPRPKIENGALPKDVILVLDKSGSMDWDNKFGQTQEALRYILDNLNPEDRFNVITFSTGVESYARGLRPAEEAAEARRWVDEQVAIGSTDINRALLEAASMADRERPTYLIFLTDGLPTEGVQDSQQILDNFAEAAPRNLRLFAFGVGFDVDTFLLDSLAQAHHGSSTYVLPSEELDEVISAFYAKVSTPVLTDLELDFGDLSVYDLYPSPLPDLFSGSQIVLVGRYRDGGTEDVILSGEVNQQTQTFTFNDQEFVEDSRGDVNAPDSLPRLWATRKIGYLLNQIRLVGPDEETIDQIVRLSIRYGIVTPYTSYLVTEPSALGEEAQDRIVQEQLDAAAESPALPSFGQAAVERAAAEGALSDAEAPVAAEPGVAEVVRQVGAQTFVLVDGVWTDTRFDPDTMETVKVAFLSDDYFALAAARPDLAAAFALGERVIALSDGVAYEVVGGDDDADPITIPNQYETPTPEAVSTQDDVAPWWERWNPRCLNALLPLALLPMAVYGRRKR